MLLCHRVISTSCITEPNTEYEFVRYGVTKGGRGNPQWYLHIGVIDKISGRPPANATHTNKHMSLAMELIRALSEQ